MQLNRFCRSCLLLKNYFLTESHISKRNIISIPFPNTSKPPIVNPSNKVTEPVFEDDLKKKRTRLRRSTGINDKPGHWKIVAYATAQSYNLHFLKDALGEQNLYTPSELTSNEALKGGLGSALHTVAKYQVSSENRHLYYFEEGMVVMWNVTETEEATVLEFLKPHEVNSYNHTYVMDEVETMTYTYNSQSKRTYIHDGIIYIGTMERSPEDVAADRFTLSNAMSLSVKLGVLEALLDDYIQDIEYLTDDLRFGKKLKINQRDVLRKSGELFALKHSINLSTDLLDIPDFYWEQEQLENLYKKTCYYFSIQKRTKVMNEKLNNCIELIQLLSTHLSDRHHVRLEWMIIILICVEVVFEMMHFF